MIKYPNDMEIEPIHYKISIYGNNKYKINGSNLNGIDELNAAVEFLGERVEYFRGKFYESKRTIENCEIQLRNSNESQRKIAEKYNKMKNEMISLQQNVMVSQMQRSSNYPVNILHPYFGYNKHNQIATNYSSYNPFNKNHNKNNNNKEKSKKWSINLSVFLFIIKFLSMQMRLIQLQIYQC